MTFWDGVVVGFLACPVVALALVFALSVLYDWNANKGTS